MGVFTNRAYYSEGASVNVEAIECPKHLSFEEAAMNIMIESEQNYNAIMQAVAISELAYLEENGTEMIYEASSISGFLGKVKEFFKNLLAKIKGLFNKFFALVDSYAASDADFVKKYKAQLLRVNTKDFVFKGYKFTKMANMDTALDKVAEKTREVTKDNYTDPEQITSSSTFTAQEMEKFAKLDMEDVLEEMRGAALEGAGGSDGKYTASEFSEELFQLYRNGETSKEEIDNVSVSELLTVISSTKDLRKKAEKQFKVANKNITEMIKAVEKVEKELTKLVPDTSDKQKSAQASDAVKVTSHVMACMRHEAALLQTVNAAQLKALKDQNRQAKSVCVSLLTYKPKNESYAYGDEYGSYTEGSFIDRVSNVRLK